MTLFFNLIQLEFWFNVSSHSGKLWPLKKGLLSTLHLKTKVTAQNATCSHEQSHPHYNAVHQIFSTFESIKKKSGAPDTITTKMLLLHTQVPCVKMQVRTKPNIERVLSSNLCLQQAAHYQHTALTVVLQNTITSIDTHTTTAHNLTSVTSRKGFVMSTKVLQINCIT